MELPRLKRRKYDIEEVNQLLANNIELASDIHIDIDKCMHPTVLKWLENYNDMTSGQPISLYYSLMATIAHISIESTVIQWNHIPRYLNLYAIIIGYSGLFYLSLLYDIILCKSGVSKSGSVRECREALEELYEFLSTNSIGSTTITHSILDKFTEAGFIDQLKESTNVIVIQEEVDVALKQMSFFSTNTPDSNRQMFCQLFDGLTMRKKTKGYQQKIRNARMTICGTSTGVLLPPVLQDFLKHVMTDGVVVRCLFLVLGYQQYVRSQKFQTNYGMPSIAQILLTVTVLGRHQYIYSEEAQALVDNYIEDLTKQACDASCSRLASFLAKQATQIIRISALTQIIDLLPSIIQLVNIERTPNDVLGLNIRLFNQMNEVIRSSFENIITITKESTSRAIYFHGYLLEQTLKLFDISSFDNASHNISMHIGIDLEIMLSRQILMLPSIIIMKENLYTTHEYSKINRNRGTKSFEALVAEGLLLKDYFVMTNTGRPVICYAKVLPSGDNECEIISKKLRMYNVQVSDYIELSRSVGVSNSCKLTSIGIDLLMKAPYSKIYQASSITAQSSTMLVSSLTSSTNSQSSFTTTLNSELPMTNSFVSSALTLKTEEINRCGFRSTVKRKSQNKSSTHEQAIDFAEEHDIVTVDETNSNDDLFIDS